MLCFEGISLMLNIFRGKRDAPQYTLAPPAGGQLEYLTAHREVSGQSEWSLGKSAQFEIDVENKALCFRGDPSQYQIYTSTI